MAGEGSGVGVNVGVLVGIGVSVGSGMGEFVGAGDGNGVGGTAGAATPHPNDRTVKTVISNAKADLNLRVDVRISIFLSSAHRR